ncbi:hypothetical protein PILCRDRAFT_810578 [Piloderma croceum F 1598]|uniref:F-box domain-containing protein n=1 Tax=Piloderma croceum (strain F 1598) TaxID=765440 RepID=A0A0C3CNK7_PILCF|nr:hypothetical protein PILCRDRAFT_810578 [Piloderma croceum F 1598]
MIKDDFTKLEIYSIKVQPAFDKLSLDIIVHIFSFVQPLDIIPVRQTCKTLSYASRERIVWMNALRRVCARHGVFAPTFPIADMTVLQLEHSATSPTRLLARIRRDLPTGSIQPMCTRMLTKLPATSAFHDTILVPGGRFLFTRSPGNIIELWDLGFSPDSVIRLIASEFFQDKDIFIVYIQPKGDGLGILVIVKVELTSNTFQYEVLEIHPSSPAPVFRRVGLLPFEEPSFAVSFTDDLFVIIQEAHVTVWNVVQDSWVKWQIDMEAESAYGMQCVKCDENLVLVNDNTISMWRIPPLVNRSINPNPPIEVRRPLFRHILHVPTGFDGSMMVSRIGWPPSVSSKAHPFHFDVLYDQNDLTTTLGHHILHPIDNDVSEGLPSCFPLFVGETCNIPSSYDNSMHQRVEWLSPNDMLYIWTKNSDIMVMLSTLSASTDVPNKQSSGIMWKSGLNSNAYPDTEFCPFSGRACVMDRQWEFSAAAEIRVMDYLLPLSR